VGLHRRTLRRRGRARLCLDMAREIVKDRLPPLPLLFDRMRLLAVERNAHQDASWRLHELDPRRPVAEGVLDQLVLDDLGIGSSEIEAHAPILRLHARRELASLAQIDRGGCRMPVIGGRIPLLDVRGCRISIPDLLDGSRNVGLDGDFHDRFPFWLAGLNTYSM